MQNLEIFDLYRTFVAQAIVLAKSLESPKICPDLPLRPSSSHDWNIWDEICWSILKVSKQIFASCQKTFSAQI